MAITWVVWVMVIKLRLIRMIWFKRMVRGSGVVRSNSMVRRGSAMVTMAITDVQVSRFMMVGLVMIGLWFVVVGLVVVGLVMIWFWFGMVGLVGLVMIRLWFRVIGLVMIGLWFGVVGLVGLVMIWHMVVRHMVIWHMRMRVRVVWSRAMSMRTHIESMWGNKVLISMGKSHGHSG